MDMVPGRSKKVFTTWLASQSDTWRKRIERACSISLRWMDSPALRAQPPKNSPARGRSWIPSTSCALVGDALDECRRHTGQELHHRRGRATDPLYKARRMLHTRSCLLTPRQQHQILDLFASDCHVALEVTWSVYQNITWRLP